jgi:hypothetical protein
MYALLLAITTKGVALGVTVLNRLTITASRGCCFSAGLAGVLPRPSRDGP